MAVLAREMSACLVEHNSLLRIVGLWRPVATFRDYYIPSQYRRICEYLCIEARLDRHRKWLYCHASLGVAWPTGCGVWNGQWINWTIMQLLITIHSVWRYRHAPQLTVHWSISSAAIGTPRTPGTALAASLELALAVSFETRHNTEHLPCEQCVL